MVTREYPPYSIGGIAKHTYHLVRNLRRLGVNCTVLAFGCQDRIENETIFLKARSNILGSLNQNASPLQDLGILLDIKRISVFGSCLFHKRGYDVFHVQEPLFAPFVPKFKSVTTVHTTRAGEFMAIARDLRTLRDLEYAVFFGSFGFLLDFMNLRRTNHVIAVSKSIQKELINFYHMDSKKITVIPNAAPEWKNVKEPCTMFNDGDLKVVLTVGRMVARKSFEILLRSIKLLQTSLDLHNVQFIFVGDGPRKPYLTSLARKLGIEQSLVFTGRVSDQELFNLYDSVDIFVFPSRYEGYPITLLEAMVSGLPCIASDIPSNCDIITNERDGLFFRVDDFVDLSRKLHRLLVDHRLRGVFSRNAKRKAKQFDWKKIAQDTIAVYEKVAVQAKR